MQLIALPSNIPWLSLIGLSPLLAIVLLLIVPARRVQAIRLIGTASLLLSLLLSLLVYAGYNPQSGQAFQLLESLPWFPQIGANYLVAVDGSSVLLLLLSGVVLFSGAMVSWAVTDRVREYWVLYLVLAAGAYGLVSTLNLLLLFVFLELLIWPLYLLLGGWGATRNAQTASRVALLLASGSALVLLGVIALFSVSGLRTFDIRLLAQSALWSQTFQIVAFVPFFLGFAVLAGIVPFHVWGNSSLVTAPPAVAMLQTGVLMPLGVYGWLRVAWWILPAGVGYWQLPIIIVATLGIIYAAFRAFQQSDLAALFGYLFAAVAGVSLLGLSAANALSLQATVGLLMGWGLAAALICLVLGKLLDTAHTTRLLADLGGLWSAAPLAMVALLLALVSLVGLPGLAAIDLVTGLWESRVWLALIAAAGLLFLLGFGLWTLYRVGWGETPASVTPLAPVGWQEYVALGLLALLILVSSLYPPLLSAPAARGVASVAAALQHVLLP